MLVGGQARDGAGGDRLEVLDPATGELVDTVPAGTPADVDAAVEAALAAFAGWWATPAARRGELLGRAAGHARGHAGELAASLTREQGKPLREARLEVERCLETLEHYAGLAKNLRGGYVPNLDTDAYGMVLRRPLGVVGAIVPWNFPTTLLANKLGPALVAGNTVVAKPAETTPLTTLRWPSCSGPAACRPGRSTSSPGPGRWPGTPWSATQGSARSPSPAPPRWAAAPWPPPPSTSSGSPWSWAGRTR